MARRPELASILLGTSDPERLGAWYDEAFDPEIEEFGWRNFGGVGVLIDRRDDVAETTAEPGRVILNFHVEDALATAAHLDTMGVSWIAEVEKREHGLFGTLADPDGNYVQILQFDQPSKGHPHAMFAHSKAFSGFSVNDLGQARKFYGETLGVDVLELEEEGLIALNIEGNENNVLCYEKADHSPAAFTILNFPVPDVAETVDELTRRGVTMERYDDFDQDERGIFREGMIAWFKDPAGNVLSVMQIND